MAEELKSRKILITINNPTIGETKQFQRDKAGNIMEDENGEPIVLKNEDGSVKTIMHDYTDDKIKIIMEKLKPDYWCMSKEKGEKETEHIHIYMHRESGIRFSTLKNKIPIANLQARNASDEVNRNYVFKEGEKYNKTADGHYEYITKRKLEDGKRIDVRKTGINYEESHYEVGEPVKENQGKRNDIEKIKQMVEAGENNLKIKQEVKSAFHFENCIDAYRKDIMKERYSKEKRDLTCIWIDGNSGYGKSTYLLNRYKKDLYLADCGVQEGQTVYAFDDYEYEKVVLLDEYDSSYPINMLKMYCQGNPCTLRCRNKNKFACYEKIYIASNTPLYEQYPNISKKETQHFVAFKRRIQEVWYFYALGKFIVIKGDYDENGQPIKTAYDKYKKLVDDKKLQEVCQFKEQLSLYKVNYEEYRNTIETLKQSVYKYVKANESKIYYDYISNPLDETSIHKNILGHILVMNVNGIDISRFAGVVYLEIDEYIKDLLALIRKQHKYDITESKEELEERMKEDMDSLLRKYGLTESDSDSTEEISKDIDFTKWGM